MTKPLNPPQPCPQCGTPDWLERHHLFARGHPDREKPENIISLCAVCHKSAHGGPFGGDRTPPWDDERRARFSQAMSDHWDDPEWRSRTVARQRAGLTPEKLTARNAAISRARHRPDVQAKISRASKTSWERTDYRRQQAESHRLVYTNPANSAKLSLAIREGIQRAGRRQLRPKRLPIPDPPAFPGDATALDPREAASRGQRRRWAKSCVYCGFRRYLRWHRLQAKSLGGTINPREAILLCPNCHTSTHIEAAPATLEDEDPESERFFGRLRECDF